METIIFPLGDLKNLLEGCVQNHGGPEITRKTANTGIDRSSSVTLPGPLELTSIDSSHLETEPTIQLHAPKARFYCNFSHFLFSFSADPLQ